MRKKAILAATTLILIVAASAVNLTLVTAAPEVPYGPWVDEVIFYAEADPAKVLDMLIKGDIHIHMTGIRPDPVLISRIRAEPLIAHDVGSGVSWELTFNPVGPEFRDGSFNPFSNPRIREAMNWLIDRRFIVNEYMSGYGYPKWLPINTVFPDYARLADVAKVLEAKYSYNPDLAKEVIFEELVKMGCEYIEGKWYYKGKPVTIKVLIRIEDERRQIGDYVADLLEKLGFTVERMYRDAVGASPIWIGSDPADGLWHVYTGGWISTIVARDVAYVWGYYYTPLGRPEPLWQAYKPDPLFYEIARRLWVDDYRTFEERQMLMAKAAELALKDSVRVWIADRLSPYLRRRELKIAADLSGGYSAAIWSRTIRFVDRVGGTVKATQTTLFVAPWNPVAGTNWIFDNVPIWATSSFAFIYNPYTGFPMAERVINVTIYVEKGIDTRSVSDWLTVKFVDKVEVPPDAWWGFDTKRGKVITAGEAGVRAAKVRVVANYGDVLGKFKYHDGTVMTLADWVVTWPLTFHRVDPESPLYDTGAVPAFTEWRPRFMGWRILSTSPLVIEWYGNYTHYEAEFIATYYVAWPNMPWHVYAIGIRAEEKGRLAFSSGKARRLRVEWMNYIGGPSLTIFEELLDEMIRTGYIPFEEFAGQYVSVEEARARYEALMRWYRDRGHFWVASGPFYLDRVDHVARVIVLKANRNYPDRADRWAWLEEPPIPEVKLEVPESIVPGLPAEILVRVSTKGRPYPVDRIEAVKYLVFDAAGNVLSSGTAKPVADGLLQIVLPATDTGRMSPGPYKLLTFTISYDIALPITKEADLLAISQVAYMMSLLARTEAKISDIEKSLGAQISELSSQIRGLASSLNVAIALSVIALILALIALVTPYIRKPKAAPA